MQHTLQKSTNAKEKKKQELLLFLYLDYLRLEFRAVDVLIHQGFVSLGNLFCKTAILNPGVTRGCSRSLAVDVIVGNCLDKVSYLN